MSEQETHRLILMPSGRQGDVPAGITLLHASELLGVEIESICGGRQTCGKCLVEPEYGHFPKHGIHSNPDHLTPPTQSEQDYAHQHGIDVDRQRMSCVACITGDLLITIPEESQARKQVVRKEAGDITVDVKPAVQLAYIEVAPAELGGPADWTRVKQALAEQWDLPDVTLDPVLLPGLQKALRDGNWTLTITIWNHHEIIRIEPGYTESLYGFAVDIGSTTIAGYLCDLLSGEVVATVSMMNPQVRYGEDLMSRVSYGMMEAQGVNRMHRAVISALNDLVINAAQQAGIEPSEVTELVLVGNTIMHHLLLGIDPVELGGAPFALATHDPVVIKARDLQLKNVHPGAMIHILPCIAGHVGADNVGVLLAEQPVLDDKISLIVDIGTNAEILLGNRDRVLSASSPTGPAFEGAQISHGLRAAPGAIERVRIDRETGQPRFKIVGDDRWSNDVEEGFSLKATGICGSGIIEVVAELFMAGLIDSGGLFVKDKTANHPRIRYRERTAEYILALPEETATGKEIVVTQLDIRQIQLAKGALYAGVRLLMDHMGVDSVDRIHLAGAFGNYINPTHAMILGLIPDCDLQHVKAIGNAAGDGARIALINVDQRAEIEQIARTVEYVETAVAAKFQQYFLDAMAIPHATDPFPQLSKEVALPSGLPSRRTRKRRRT